MENQAERHLWGERSRFKNARTWRFYSEQAGTGFPQDIYQRARMRVHRVLDATSLGDLRMPPSHRLEALRGGRRGQYSIRVNDQWRVCFVWTEQGAMQVEIVDYH